MTIRKVLCPIDLSTASGPQLAATAALAGKLGAQLFVQHDVRALPPAAIGVGWMQASEEHERGKDDEGPTVAKIRELLAVVPPSVKVKVELTKGPRAQAIVALAKLLPADLIVMTTHPHEEKDHSVTREVLASTPCPLLVLHEDAPFAGTLGRVVVPVDLTPATSRVLAFAFELAEKLPVQLDLLHVVSPYSSDARAQLEGMVPKTIAERVTVHLRSGFAAPEITDEARAFGADLILLGVRHRGLIERLLLHSTAEDVLAAESRPLLFVPAA